LRQKARENFVTALASRYGARLRRFFMLRLRNEADAPDLAQEVFLRLMRVEHHETIRCPEAYLFTVASHVLHQHTLRQANTPATVDISDVFAELQLTSSDDPAARAEGQQRLNDLERALILMPAKISSALLLHRFAGLSIEQIGRELGVSRPAAKKYLARALTQCRDALEEGDAQKLEPTREGRAARAVRDVP
jgi:RNA polymerase sigma factor (sigma-70 family)